MKVLISLDGEAVLKELTVTPPARIPAALPHPGFVRCTVLPLTRNAKPILCAVGVDPDQLRPLLLEPADFDEFWKNTKKELSAIPADFKMHKIGSNKTFNYYQISCANLNGQRAYAFLSLPVDPSRKMPLYVRAPGGEGTCSEDMIERSVKEEMGFECARLIFQLPPYPPVKKDADRKTRQDKFLKEIGVEHYAFYGLNDRNKFYARTAVAGCLRLLDEALKQPGLDLDRVVYYGSSHGGAFGLYLAAFSDKLKAAFCGVPAYADRGGFLAGRNTPVCNYPELRKNLENALYFDTAFAARRIEIPVMIGVGFIDVSCPPSAVYTIYNELRGPKLIFNKIKHGHEDSSPEYLPLSFQWLAGQITFP